MAPSRTGQVWSGWAGVCGGRVCWRGRGGGYVRGNGVEGALSEGERWPWLWRSAFGRRWKRGRPFPRAARSFHQPPQLAGSAAAPPALTELTPGRAACRAVAPAFPSRARAAPATPACATRTRPIASQAPPSRGWHVASCRSAPLLPTSSANRAACRAAGAVSLRSTPPFTPFAFAHIRSGPPSYDAEGGTGSGHPATSALAGRSLPGCCCGIVCRKM